MEVLNKGMYRRKRGTPRVCLCTKQREETCTDTKNKTVSATLHFHTVLYIWTPVHSDKCLHLRNEKRQHGLRRPHKVICRLCVLISNNREREVSENHTQSNYKWRNTHWLNDPFLQVKRVKCIKIKYP